MEETEILKSAAAAVSVRPVEFEIDVQPGGGVDRLLRKWGWRKAKRSFQIKPLTLHQLQQVSTLLLEIDITNLSADAILRLMSVHAYTSAHIVAIAVTESRQKPSKALIDLFFHNLSKDDMSTALNIVLEQMSVVNFITTIASIRSLNVLEKKPVSVTSAGETSPIVPGALSAVS